MSFPNIFTKEVVDEIIGRIHGKESTSFGVLNKTEWNNMFYKHLNHHLSQFGV